MKENIKIAIVHDFLVQFGGAERVLEVLCEMFPQAPIYTLLYDKEKIGDRFKGRKIIPSYLQSFPKFLRKHYQWLLPFFMIAPETFDLREFDLVISSTGAWSKGLVTRLNTIHISYLHSPMRFAWEAKHNYAKGFFSRSIMSYVRMWDKLASQRPDYLIANSKYTESRIQKYYGRESTIIYPPVFSEAENNFQFSIFNFQTNSNDQISNDQKNTKYQIQDTRFFLIVSRLSPYKKIDVAIEAFNKLGLPLVIIGDGKEKKNLEKIAKNNVKILGFVNDKKLKEYYSNARALIFPADDDFGMVMVEAMSLGIPVIAFKKGGTLEIVEEGKTGEFFASQTSEVLADGVRRFMAKESNYNKEDIIKRASDFSTERFKRELLEFINRVL